MDEKFLIPDTEAAEVTGVAEVAEAAKEALLEEIGVAEDPVEQAADGHRVGPH